MHDNLLEERKRGMFQAYKENLNDNRDFHHPNQEIRVLLANEGTHVCWAF
jgi:hypothetical protein